MTAFDSGIWAPEKCQYGLLHMLMCREVFAEDLSKTPPTDRLKAMPQAAVSPIMKPARKEAPALEELEQVVDDDACSYISEGEPLEPSELVSWGKSKRGAWWRVRGALREDLVIRTGISASSAEVRRAAPGEVFQQKGMPRLLTSGKSQGCIRMPVQPSGWVTADASRAGGPQYLIRTHAPNWRVIYQSPGNGAGSQDIIVRSEDALDSEAIGSFSCGDLVEQSGPLIVRHDGISRMQVTGPLKSNGNGDKLRITGWVTVDATALGGPVFFKMIQEDSPNGNQKGNRRGRH
mmetsp:Transcript_52259/g.93739  ORF Transcript_52259/g.93739 Transcript_52259/m.93739 type:complete len:291 (+) Transcript_52259:92-964(+)